MMPPPRRARWRAPASGLGRPRQPRPRCFQKAPQLGQASGSVPRPAWCAGQFAGSCASGRSAASTPYQSRWSRRANSQLAVAALVGVAILDRLLDPACRRPGSGRGSRRRRARAPGSRNRRGGCRRRGSRRRSRRATRRRRRAARRGPWRRGRRARRARRARPAGRGRASRSPARSGRRAGGSRRARPRARRAVMPSVAAVTSACPRPALSPLAGVSGFVAPDLGVGMEGLPGQPVGLGHLDARVHLVVEGAGLASRSGPARASRRCARRPCRPRASRSSRGRRAPCRRDHDAEHELLGVDSARRARRPGTAARSCSQ